MKYATSLEGGFAAFWHDSGKRTDDREGVRQAFKNGASIVGARLLTRGRDSITVMTDQAGVVQYLMPWVSRNMKVHPEWGQEHKMAVVAGGLAAIVLVMRDMDLLEEIEQFEP